MNRKPNHEPETAHQRSIKKPRNQALLLRLRRYWITSSEDRFWQS
jgi:hypothetical protein